MLYEVITSYDVGAHLNIVLVSVPEGEDKIEKYPVMFRAADLVLITKTDLLPYFDFSVDRAKAAARKLVITSYSIHYTKLYDDALLVTLRGVYYTKTPYGTQKVPKNEAKMVLKSWQSFESVKRINSDEGMAPLGVGLELSLTGALSTLHVGDKLRLLVTVDGQPKADVAVAYGERVIGASDAEGHINVKIREPGLQHVRASYTVAGDGTLCDSIVHATELNLESYNFV